MRPITPATTSGDDDTGTAYTKSMRDTTLPSSSGRGLALLSLVAAFVGFILEAVNALTVYAYHTRSNTGISVATVLLTLAAITLGVCAQARQKHCWSRRTRQRLRIGLPVAVLTLALTLPNFREKNEIPPAHDSEVTSDRPAPSPPPPSRAATSETSLVWYAELKKGGLLFSFASTAPSAPESVDFNSRLSQHVSYATLSIVNIGHATPVELDTLDATLGLEDGKTVHSLPLEPLLAQNKPRNGDLLRKLESPRRIAMGNMMSDLPICFPQDLAWDRVTTVTLSVGGRPVTLSGGLLASEEKQRRLEHSATFTASESNTNAVSAEVWFRNL